MIAYLLSLTLFWFLFLGLYHFALRKETFFSCNRGYLLVTFVLGLVLPLSDFWHQAIPALFHIELGEVTVFASGLPQIEPNTFQYSTFPVLWILYGVGLLLFLFRLVFGLAKIYRLKINGVTKSFEGVRVNHSEIDHPPFSFMNTIFLGEKSGRLSPNEQAQILAHEKAHINGGHSYDLLLVEVVKLFLWFHPLIYWYKNVLKDQHEFLADQKAIEEYAIPTYGRLLLSQVNIKSRILPVHFFHSQIVKRIDMMTKNHSQRKALLKYLLLIPILIVGMIGCKEGAEVVNPTTDLEVSSIDTEEVLEMAEQMPEYPGCEDISSKDDRSKCAQKKMLEYIYTNVKYPAEARDLGLEGMVVLGFIIDKKGKIKDVKVVKGVHETIDQEALRVIEKMATESIWMPGVDKGKAVSVSYKLPIKFKLMD